MDMQRDWIFAEENWKCGVRVAGVLIRNGKILLQREADGCEYAVPGGHIRIGERLEDGLKREWLEETGLSIRCQRMLWTEESFWEWNGKAMHDLSFYYLIETEDDEALADDGLPHAHKDNGRILLEWVPAEKLAGLTVYPSFLKTEMHHLGEPVQHFTTYA